MLETALLEYDLPEHLVAVRPAEPRENARLMVVSRSDPGRIEHRRVNDLPDCLSARSTLVFNRTRVMPARFIGQNLDTGGRIEGLWLEDAPDRPGYWHAMVRARRHRPGRTLELVDESGEFSGVRLRLGERVGDDGVWLLKVEDRLNRSTREILHALGRTPLPPYIRSARKKAGLEIPDQNDRRDYQTVFAADDDAGGRWSVAAPTAGLHFTESLLGRTDALGIGRREVVLDVGAGTFKPIETEIVEQHPMHSEWCSLDGHDELLDGSGPVIAVGSTSARTLESFALRQESGQDISGWISTDLMITPGYRWRRVDGMVTNFHLPRSTLLLMVGAFLPGGIERLLDLYRQAIELEYRFYSYGDAMLILP